MKTTLGSLYGDLYTTVTCTTPRGSTLKKYISFAIGINLWIVDPKVYVKRKGDDHWEVILVKCAKNIYGNIDKEAAINHANNSIWESSQWL